MYLYIDIHLYHQRHHQYHEYHAIIVLKSRLLPDSPEILQRLRLTGKLEVHAGCVNTLSWNYSGTLLLSGSDDHKLVLTNPFTQR